MEIVQGAEILFTKTTGIIVGGAAAMGALYKGWKNVVRPTLDKIKERDERDKRIDSALSELRPNGGKSIKDVISRIESDLSDVVFRQHANMHLSQIALYEADLGGACTWVNKRWMELTGMDFEEAAGFGWLNAIHQEDRAKVESEWERAVNNNHEFNMSYRIVNKHKGTIVNVKGTAIINRLNKKIIGTANEIQ